MLENFGPFCQISIHLWVWSLSLLSLSLSWEVRAKIATRTPPKNGGTGGFKITTATNHATRGQSSNTDPEKNQTSGFTQKSFPSLGQLISILHTESNAYVHVAALRAFLFGVRMVRKLTIRSSNFEQLHVTNILVVPWNWREILPWGIWLRSQIY